MYFAECKKSVWAMAMHAFSFNTREAEAQADESLILRLYWSMCIERVPDEPGLHRKTLSQTNKQSYSYMKKSDCTNQ